MNRRGWIGTVLLFVVVVAIAALLAAWKYTSIQQAIAASADQPEPMETITTALARPYEYRRTSTSIGTVLALRSITLRNEVPGTVKHVTLTPGEIVETGQLLVALDVAVEEAELKAQEAQAALAETVLGRMQRASESQAVSAMEVDKARAERDMALAHSARLKAIIDRKTIRAPFRARVGLADVHPGQYLEAGTLLTTLQGVENDPAVHIDFNVAQHIAAGLRVGDTVEVVTTLDTPPAPAVISAIDARIDQMTRNAMIRATMTAATSKGVLPTPGSSVRVRTVVGEPLQAVVVPVDALRRGPEGDHVYVIAPDDAGHERAFPRMVQSGAMIGDEVLIFSGVKPGEKVASSGSFKLREGVRIAISPETPAPASSSP